MPAGLHVVSLNLGSSGFSLFQPKADMTEGAKVEACWVNSVTQKNSPIYHRREEFLDAEFSAAAFSQLPQEFYYPVNKKQNA
eukprot:2397145-Amphidinium_carterae.1